MCFILDILKKELCYVMIVYFEWVFCEVVVNVFYYGSYESCYVDWIKIYIKLKFIDIISYFGLDFSLN